MKTDFFIMHMPESIDIAVLVGDDDLVDSKTLLVMRNEAWRIVAGMGFFDENGHPDVYPRA
tara:strand:- start:396 stop:578 length:183 start_codon:yes stop_codon:yes gene_type:complete